MTYISPAIYDEQEAKARRAHCNRVVAAFSPTTFAKVGYPTRVDSDVELAKFADVMQEDRTFRHLDTLHKLTDHEYALLKEAVKILSKFSEHTYKKRIIPKAALLSSLIVYREIKHLQPSARVFEIGPGCGYLGLLLGLDGFTYASMDVTQAFYLLQNHLYHYAFGDKFVDLAYKDASFGELSGTITHVPWWKYYTQDKLAPFDILTGNAVFAEMHPHAFEYMLRATRKQEIQFIAFRDWGYQLAGMHHWYLNARLYARGFSLAHHDDLITIYAPHDAPGVKPMPTNPVPAAADLATIQVRAHQYGPKPWIVEPYSSLGNLSTAIYVSRNAAAKPHDEDKIDGIWRKYGVSLHDLTDDELFLSNL